MSIPSPAFDIGDFPDAASIRVVAPGLAAAAQAVYDAWDQGPDGLDPELGAGGICHEIADAFLPILTGAGVEHCLTFQAACGENHIYVIALLADGVYEVDVSPYVYESGGGYTWRKKPDVVIGPDDVTVSRIADPMTPDEFEQAYVE
jgi:hypothetical protein